MSAKKQALICKVLFVGGLGIFAAIFFYFMALMQIGSLRMDVTTGHVVSLADHGRYVYITTFQYMIWVVSLGLAALSVLVAIALIILWKVRDD